MARPEPVEWPKDDTEVDRLAHGTPLLTDGELWAAWRDANFLVCPDTSKPKAAHVIVVNHLPQMRSGKRIANYGAACNPKIMLDLMQPAHAFSSAARCTRPACNALFAKADVARLSVSQPGATATSPNSSPAPLPPRQIG